jgi:Phosphodiester glycosidase
MSRPARLLSLTALVCALLSVLPRAHDAGLQRTLSLGERRDVAAGVSLHHLTDPNLVDPAAPLSIWMLRVDPSAAEVRPVLANDAIVDTETVADMGRRYDAIAAVNAGFFLLPSGDPAGIYKLRGQLVSDTRRTRGAVGIIRDGPHPRFIFGRVAASMSLRVRRRARPDMRVQIAGVDTTRTRRMATLFTPAYHTHTDTQAGGLEWILEGRPLRVRGAPETSGKTTIPKDGFVLSYGGTQAPAALRALAPGTRVELETRYTPIDGTAGEWEKAEDIIGGAGLLARDGRFLDDWSVERLAAGFAETRHPRTMIGTHADGSLWLITIDGRQPQLSAGMTLAELRALARRLSLTNALNLDGGGSTTMWIQGQVVNSPADAAGPRKVSDALLVMKREPSDPKAAH